MTDEEYLEYLRVHGKSPDKEKYFTYESTMYDEYGNVIEGIAEENTSEVFTTDDGYEYSTILYDSDVINSKTKQYGNNNSLANVN